MEKNNNNNRKVIDSIYMGELEISLINNREDKNELSNDIDVLHSQINSLKDQIEEYTNKLTITISNLENCNKEKIELEDEKKKLITDVEKKDNEVKALKNRINQQKNEINSIKIDLQNRDNKINKLEKQLNENGNELFDSLNNKIKELNDNNIKLNNKIKKLEKELNDNNIKSNNKIKKLEKELQDNNIKSKNKIKELEQLNDNANKLLDSLNNKIKELNEKNLQLNNEIKKLEKELKDNNNRNFNDEINKSTDVKNKGTEFYEKKSENNALNYISLNISSIDDLIGKGWKITKNYKEDFKEELIDENRKGLIIGFLGDNYEGKTYYINKIFKCNLSLEPTNNINYYYINKNIRIIDIPGTNKIILPKMNNDLRDTIFGYQKDKLLQDEILETKKKDFIIQKFIIDNSIINIMIISSFNLETKKRIGKLIRIFNENYQNTSVIKSLYIIHNNLKIKSDEDYNKYIENNFPKGYYYNKDNLVFTEKLNEEAEHKFEVLHFIPKSYKKEDEVIIRINEQIYSHLQINLSKFNDMLLYTFNQISHNIISENPKCEITENHLKITCKKNINDISLGNSIIWFNFKVPIPDYICYINNNNEFIFEINLAGFKILTIKKDNLPQSICFSVKAKRQKENIKEIIQINRALGDEINFEIKIDKLKLKGKTLCCEEEKEINGLTIYKYKLENL